MLASKGLLLKGLLGVGAAVSVTCVGLNYSRLFAGKREEAININIPGEGEVKELNKLLDKVGLSCDLNVAGVECFKKEGDGVKVKVKQEDKTFELSSLGDGGKIKVYKDEGYENKFKFVIEEGDISEGENKLEEFETYEIKEEADASNPEAKKHYLTRKTKATDEIKELLGLDSCAFPGSDATTCPISNENIKKIKFDGKDGEVTGTGSLQISKVQGDELRDYPLGFKFTLTPETNITIPRGSLGNLSLTNANPALFMIKKSGSSLTLEEVWTPDTLTEKVGLSCTVSGGQSLKTGVECTKKEETDIKVKQGKTEFNVSSIPSPAKIKLYRLTGEDADEYNKGLKFVVRGGEISGTSQNKLEEFETYEIKQDGADWKLIRKNEAKEEIRKSLGVPCLLPKEGTVTVCDIKGNVFKKIKFEGLKETEASVSGSPNLWIYKPKGSNDYGKFGYRFVLKSEEDATFSSSLTIKKNTNTEFKIKKEKDSLTLEKAWTVTELAKKVGLNCPGGGSKDCTLNESGIKVFNGENNKTENGTKPAGSDTKITFEADTEGYSQGFKFFTTSDVEIEKSPNSVKILANSGNSATYQILKDGDNWYLTKKST